MNNNDPTENGSELKNFSEAVNIFVKAVYRSGLFYVNHNFSNQIVTLLEQFYVYLDLFPDFRRFVFYKCSETARVIHKEMSEKFNAEKFLMNNHDFVYDLILYYLVEPDYTSALSIKVLSVFELICQKKEFAPLCVMVGDLYDNFFLGMSILDLEKRRFYYEITKAPKIEYGILRLAYVYKFQIDTKIRSYNKKSNSDDTCRKINGQIMQLYQILRTFCGSKYS